MNNNCHSFDRVADKEGMKMKDGIWKRSGMKVVTRLVLMAVLSVVMVCGGAGWSLADVCVGTGDYVGASGDTFRTSVGGTPGTVFSVGDTVRIEFITSTTIQTPVITIKDSADNKLLDKAGMQQSGSNPTTYYYDWNTGGQSVDFYQIEIKDDGNGNAKVGGHLELGSPNVGVWFYSDSARSNQTDTFGDGDTVYATMKIASSDTLKKIDLADFWDTNKLTWKSDGSQTDFSAGVDSGNGTTTINFHFTADFSGASLSNGDWGFIKSEVNGGDRFQRAIKRDDGYSNAAPCVETPPCSATAPSNLNAAASGPTQVNLTWTYDGTNNDYYTIYRGGTQIATNVTTGSYTDNTVSANTSYSYTVRGHSNSGGCDSADSNTASVTTPSCTESTPSSISFNGVTTASGDFSGAGMVSTVDLTNLEFRVTEGSGSGSPFPTQTDDFAGLSNGTRPNFGNWTGVNGSDGTNGWVALSGSTGSSSTGPGNGNPDPYVYLESSATNVTYGVGVTAGSSQYLESNVLDASQYAFSFTFDWDMNVADNNDASLHVDAWNGSSWDLDITGSAINTGNNNDTWVTEGPIDLSAYTNSDFKLRIRYIVGSGTIYRNDIAVDNLIISGTARSTEVERLAWNPDPQEVSAILTSGNSYNLYARGTDPECGTIYYVGGTTTPGNSQSFTWSSCTDGTPSTISITNGQTVSGANVDLTTLFSTTGNVGSFTYKLNGSAVASPWDSSSYGIFAPETVTLEVTGTDPDCGTVIVQSNTITVDNTAPIIPDWGACQVTSGRVAYANGQSSVTVPVSIADTSQAFLLVDIAGGATETNTANHMSTGYIQDAGTLRFDRVGTTGPNAWVSYQLVECFNNELYVQRGQINLPGGTASATATLAQTIDATKSLVLVSSRSDNADASQDMARVMGELTDGSTVKATRVNTTGTTTTRYEVVTFRNGSGVNLYKGTFTFDSTSSASLTQAIGATVDPVRSWLYGSWSAANDGLSQTTVGLELTNATTITAHRDATGAYQNTIRYAVVEFPNDGKTRVQRGNFLVDATTDPNAGDDNEGIVNISITPVSALNKAFSDTYNTTNGTGTAFARNSWIQRLSAVGNLQLSNWRTNGAQSRGNQYWQVIEFVPCTDLDPATLTTTNPSPATGIVTIQ
ncbi:hypothetical protein B5V00_16485, partial [Geothermobacter hydrogeniphilus]